MNIRDDAFERGAKHYRSRTGVRRNATAVYDTLAIIDIADGRNASRGEERVEHKMKALAVEGTQSKCGHLHACRGEVAGCEKGNAAPVVGRRTEGSGGTAASPATTMAPRPSPRILPVTT